MLNTVLAVTGGIAALVGAYFLGARRGRFNELTSKSQQISGHSLPVSYNYKVQIRKS